MPFESDDAHPPAWVEPPAAFVPVGDGALGQDYRGGYDEAYDDGVVSEVIRPAAVVPEDAVRAILVELSLNSAHGDGVWIAEPSRWHRYDRPWTELDAPGESRRIGTVQVAYGTPTKYEITIYRATITQLGTTRGWTVQSLCDEALAFGDLSLAQCPRVNMQPAPKPFSHAGGGARRAALGAFSRLRSGRDDD